jgi:hypothetical protein
MCGSVEGIRYRDLATRRHDGYKHMKRLHRSLFVLIAASLAMAATMLPALPPAMASVHGVLVTVRIPTCSVCDSKCYEAYQNDIERCKI